jgi:hypothetical protein
MTEEEIVSKLFAGYSKLELFEVCFINNGAAS